MAIFFTRRSVCPVPARGSDPETLNLLSAYFLDRIQKNAQNKIKKASPQQQQKKPVLDPRFVVHKKTNERWHRHGSIVQPG